MCENSQSDRELEASFTEFPLWKNEDLESIPLTVTRRRTIYNQNLLVQFQHLDNNSLFLAIKTADNKLDLKGLYSLYINSGHLPDTGETKKVLSCALDILLDCGIFRAKWELENDEFHRVFVNRNELFDMFAPVQDKIDCKLSEMNFIDSASVLRDKIHIGEDPTLTFNAGYYDKRIVNMEKEFTEFMNECLILPEKYDVIIPLPRKGWAMIEHIKDKADPSKANIKVHYNIYDTEKLEGKRICIFDDAVKHGQHLCDALEHLVSKGIPASDISLVTFLLNRDEYEGKPNDIGERIRELLGNDRDIKCYRKLNDLEFHRKVADIVMYIAHFGRIIDTDHIVLTYKLARPISCKEIMKILKGLGIGTILEPGINIQHLFPQDKKITINDVDYESVTGEKLPASIKEIAQCKIRTIWQYDEKTFEATSFDVSAIINPTIRKKGKNFACPNTNQGFCSVMPEYDNICVDCTLFSVIPKLTYAFMKKLAAKIDISLVFEKMQWVEFQSSCGENSQINKQWRAYENEFKTEFSKVPVRE